MFVTKSSSYAVVKTALESQLLIQSLIEKNSTSGLITATEELYTKLQVWGRCNALYRILVTSFQQEKQYFLMC